MVSSRSAKPELGHFCRVRWGPGWEWEESGRSGWSRAEWEEPGGSGRSRGGSERSRVVVGGAGQSGKSRGESGRSRVGIRTVFYQIENISKREIIKITKQKFWS